MTEYAEESNFNDPDDPRTQVQLEELQHKVESNTATLSEKAKYQWLKDPDKAPGEVISFTKQELTTASTEEYTDLLHLLTNIDAIPVLAANIDVIANRFKSDIKKYSKRPYPERDKAMDIGDETRKAIWLIALDPQCTVSKEIVEDLYANVFDPDPIVSHHAIEYLDNVFIIDNRNKKTGDNIDAFSKYKHSIVDKMIHPQEHGNYNLAKRLIDVAWASFPGEIEGIMIDAFNQADSELARKVIWNVCANREGLANAWKKLRSHAQIHEDFKEKLKLAEEAIGLDKVEQVHADLRDLYDKINFKDYKPNLQMNSQEADFLYAQLHDKKRVLDIGAGTGRLMNALQKRGLHVMGFDYVKSHAHQIKEMDPQSDIVVASWHEMPYKDSSFDAAYCAGRSILHNTTVEDMISFLKESHRVLTQEGTLIIDTPDPDKGLYKHAREKFAQSMQENGIEHFEDGVIYDSPDGKNFFNRLAPSQEQFKAIALLAGFKAEIIHAKAYQDSEGFDNTNWYWKLSKIPKPANDQEKLEQTEQKMHALREAYTSSAPIYLTWL